MLQSNLSMKILSFIIAIVLLFTINGNINNIFSTPNGGDYIYDVKISVRGLQDDYDVVGLPETVDVALVGPSIDIYAAKLSKNYKIIADFSSLGEGDHTIELKSDESFEQDAKIYAYDRSGKKLDVEIIPDSVHVQCDVSSYSKEVPIVPKYVGQFESGYGLKEVTLSKDKVRIYGKEELLNSVNSVNVIIDISGLSGDKTYEKLPITEMEKINRLSFDTVDVSVKVSPAVKKIITDIPINIINNTHDYRVVFANEVDKVSIEVEGVEVDLNTNKSYLSYKLLSPEKIKITLKK